MKYETMVHCRPGFSIDGIDDDEGKFSCKRLGSSEQFYWMFENGLDGADFNGCVADACPTPIIIPDDFWKYEQHEHNRLRLASSLNFELVG